ncbi:hypothetical protein BRD06_08790 [Halobacteriales archaeon QS_9_67_15]|nr:MAG: hypothetical protein BRD06_08790 [Halobacteriales archaeon QS_9_67_15]
MDRLSSCYFCGDALDATLEEHPVVPSNLHPDPESQRSVVLCSSCRQKLEVVLETVVDAVETGTGDVTAVEEGRQSDASADESASADDLESTLGDDEEILTSLDADDSADADAVDAAEASEMEFGDDRAATAASSDSEDTDATDDSGSDGRSGETKYTDSRGAGFRRDDDESAESESLTEGAFDDDDDESTGATEGRSRSGSTDSNAGSSGTSSSDRRDTESENGSNDADSPTTDRDVSLSRLENTKVMRLLENREFPVEKDEFVTVAASAYQVSRDDCEKVLGLAVEHGLLREDDGQLYDGDA